MAIASLKTGRSGFFYNAGILLRLLRFILPYKRLVLLNAFSLIGTTVFMFLMPWFLEDAIDSVRGSPTGLPIVDGLATPGTVSYLLFAAGGLFLAGASRGLFSFGQTYLSQTISQSAAYDIRNTLYASLQRQSFSFYDKVSTAELMSRATVDVEAARMLLNMGLPRPLQTTIFFGAVLVYLWLTSPVIAVIALIGIPFIGYRAVITSARLRSVWLAVQEGIAALTTVLQESLSGAKVVRSFGRQDLEIRKFDKRTNFVYETNVRGTFIRSFNNSLMTFIVYVLMAMTLLYGGREVINGQMSDGQLLRIFFYFVMLTEQVRMLGFLGDQVSRTVAAGERIYEILDAQPDITDKPGASQLGEIEGLVRFEDVSFSYNSLAPTLQNVTLDAQPDQVVAVVGATGSGKTSLMSLIPRFYDVTNGRVTIDGTDIRNVTLDSLRKNIGIVQQDVFLFSASIRDNIAYGRSGASMEEIYNVATVARLDDFIMHLPNGYDTWVGERGVTLSGGQKQRLAIARTLLLDPRILILDDSLSSVDTETEYLIQQELLDLMKGRTTFVIAHRLANLKRANQILVLQDGAIVERGTHEELLIQQGLYNDIYEMQLSDQEEALADTQLM
jgi:ATP-binding cassette subfamily B protein